MHFYRQLTLLKISLALLLSVTVKAADNGLPFDDCNSWAKKDVSEREELIRSWIDKSSDRKRWSHNARMEFASAAYQCAEDINNENMKHEAMFPLAKLLFNEGRFEEALVFFDSLLTFSSLHRKTEMEIKTRNFAGSIFRHWGEVYEAFSITYEAYIAAKENNLEALQAMSANNLAVIYRNLGENKIAENFYEEALEKAKLSADTLQIILALTGIGNMHWFEKDVHMAYDFYRDAMKLARASHDTQQIAILNNNIGNVYRERDELDTAFFFYSAALDILRDCYMAGSRAVTLRNIALVYHRKQMPVQALPYALESLEISTNTGIKNLIRDNYNLLSGIHYALGDINESHRYLQLFSDISQQIYSKYLYNRISYFNEKIFDAQRKEDVYKLKMERNFILLLVTTLFVLFLASFLFVVFKRFKDKRKHINRLKQTLQDKIITEKALRQSEENFQNLIKTLNEGLVVLDKDNCIEFLNTKAAKLLGADDKSSLTGKNFISYLLSADDVKLFQEKMELQKMGISDHYEIKLKNHKDDMMWASLSSSPILDENLKTKGSVTLISDITEKKKSDQTYNELTSDLNQKIKQINCLYDITDISGVPGITFEEIIQKSLEIIPVGLKYSHDIGVQIVFDNKQFCSENYQETPWAYSVPLKAQKKKLGHIKVVYLEEKPKIHKDPFHFSEKILLKNISEKFGQIIESKNLEKHLRQNQEKLEEVQRIAKIGNLEKEIKSDSCNFSDTFFDIIEISSEAKKFFDYSKFVEMIHPEDKEIFLKFENCISSNDENHYHHINYRLINGEGKIRFISSSGKSVVDSTGEKSGIVLTIQDVTEQKYTQELQHQAELALKTSEAKQKVLANMSFEMRTPITSVMGMVDFLIKSGLNANQLDMAKSIKDASVGLLSNINNIIDLHRIEGGKFRLNNASFSLRSFADRVNSLFAALTRSRELSLNIQIAESLPNHIVSDQTRLYQVFSNLIAILTDKVNNGKLTITLNQKSQTKTKIRIATEVSLLSDEIDKKEALSYFAQSRENLILSSEKNKDNLNIALAISRELVELLDGQLTVKAGSGGEVQFGFIFSATFPKDEYQPAVSDSLTLDTNNNDLTGIRVLCAEDQKINQKVISLMLAHVNCDLQLVNNGQEALEKLETEKYDVVLLDMVMPVMDGIETLEQIKRKIKSPPPVIALSANVLDEDRDSYFLAGINDFVSKPINADELYQKIEKWANINVNIHQKR